jgi:hypothetical protein
MFLTPQVGDDDDEEVEHGKAHDDMWTLDLKTYTVGRAGDCQGLGLLGFRDVRIQGLRSFGLCVS